MTTIEWTDRSWNPVVGCSVISPGCTNCYAMRLAGTRLRNTGAYDRLTKPRKAGPVWTGQTRFLLDRLTQPLHWRKPSKIFVCDMGDLFHESVKDEWIDQVFAVMERCPQHRFQVLTKRAERLRDYLAVLEHEDQLERWCDAAVAVTRSPCAAGTVKDIEWPLPNVWLGVSTEDQRRADERIPLLLETPATLRFISAEPLLGPIDGVFRSLDWVIVGGESGPGARPCHLEWIRAVVRQCREAGVPVFVKQLGANAVLDGQPFPTANKKGADPTEWPEDLRIRQFPQCP